jgi:hypothetical protein
LPAVDVAKNKLKPLVATETAFRRHLELDPLFAAHFATTARSLVPATITQATAPDAPNAVTEIAYFAHQAFIASSALVPDRLSPDVAHAAGRLLRRLVTALTGQEPPTPLPPAALFAAVQMALAQRLPVEKTLPAHQGMEAAIYRLRERHVVIIPETAPRELLNIGWATLLEQFGLQSTALHVATTAQMRAAISYWNPVDFALDNLEHLVGTDSLHEVDFSMAVLARALALKTSQQLVRFLPADYVTAAGSEALHGVVHDYQNKLLNIRLQHELLRRVADVAVDSPDDALPGPDAPLAQRVEAILATLDQWTERYATLALSQPPSARPAY